MPIYKLSERCSVASQIQPSDVAKIAAEGYTTIVCNRPDNEDFGQPAATAVEEQCATAGIAFRFMPISRAGISREMTAEFRSIVEASDGPVLAYCRSGQRSSVLWQMSGTP